MPSLSQTNAASTATEGSTESREAYIIIIATQAQAEWLIVLQKHWKSTDS